MRTYPERIKHIHLHDNRGGSSHNDDLHLPVGDGVIDFENIFKMLKSINYKGTITLELQPDEIKKCLEYVKRLLTVK
jgi:sugar phosphate isomerase/epimerase